MIKSFKYKGLKIFYEHSDGRLLNPYRLKRIKRLLDALGVSGNWRLSFRFIDGDAYDVDLEDYH